jgi:hypothetical protein
MYSLQKKTEDFYAFLLAITKKLCTFAAANGGSPAC